MSRQEEVDMFMNKYELDIKPEYRAMDIAAEFGELAAEILAVTDYGATDLENHPELDKEMGDLYFSLIALANRLGIDLDLALDDALEKYEERIDATDSPSSDEA